MLRLANAGMPLPILVRKGQCRPIRAEGIPLGLLEHAEYQEVSVQLESGDLFAMFSDGIVEASNMKYEEFGPRRLENVLRQNFHRSPQEIIDTLFEEVREFEQGRPPRDDQTIVLTRVRCKDRRQKAESSREFGSSIRAKRRISLWWSGSGLTTGSSFSGWQA